MLFWYYPDMLEIVASHCRLVIILVYIWPVKKPCSDLTGNESQGQKKAKVIMNIENSNQKSFDLKNLAKY